MRYFFHIGYNGFRYQGWQKLPQANSVQAVIETHLGHIFKKDISIVGCGRTDAKVHASQFFFHADLDEIPGYDVVFRLNKNLPDDIAVFDMVPVDSSAHARFDAVSRTYTYFLHTRKDPYLAEVSTPCEGNLNLEEMNRAVALLPMYDDYRSVCRNPAVHRTTRCRVTAANLYRDETGDNIRFEISANRFLNGMVRTIVKKLLKIGSGKLSVDEFEQQLVSGERGKITKGAYPQGLHLSCVEYPFLKLPCRSAFFQALARESRWRKL